MNPSNPYARYQQNSIETASPTRLVVLLYDGALRFLNQALPEMQAHRLDSQSRFIGKAQAIIAHLRATLDFETGGEVARTLEAFYVSAYDTLSRANLRDDRAKVESVIHGLRELREAWVEVDRQCQAHKSVTAPGVRPTLLAV